jgi:hypothetical protein
MLYGLDVCSSNNASDILPLLFYGACFSCKVAIL